MSSVGIKKRIETQQKTHLALGARIADRTNALKLADHVDAFAAIATRRTGALVNVDLTVSAYPHQKIAWEWHAKRKLSIYTAIYVQILTQHIRIYRRKMTHLCTQRRTRNDSR